jgi:alanyl-tRNA synthetase
MTSSEIRQSFLDFFREKQHTIVPSRPRRPDAPNLLFTNAGMNQFVPIFLGQAPCPYTPPRAADTQKCIRAGGKHNDLEDVGFDTYHHTFFEMLGNWSFGDYFKKEAIAWAWELVVNRWKFPPSRIYATVYSPGPGDPASFDREAHDHWAEIFLAAGLDPAIHIVPGNKKDNFWMMGDTGPCGPCSELHVDLTPGPRDLDLARQKEGRNLVNSGDARCIEIWNLVFIQFNANPDGTYAPLPARHVDTGMGFERVTSMIQGTKNFTDFENAKISNYETDIFRPLFDELEKITGKTYTSTLPASAQNLSEQEKIDVAFRVIADHIRTLSFSIADGIQPSNEGRSYVLRRILRRAVSYGNNLGLIEPFLGKLVDVLGKTMGQVFPEVVTKADSIKKTLLQEEQSFMRTLERGNSLFNEEANRILQSVSEVEKAMTEAGIPTAQKEEPLKIYFPGDEAFMLYDTYGFPLDLTELKARERGLTVDVAEFNRLMEEQKARGRDSQRKEIIEVVKTGGDSLDVPKSEFVGFDQLSVITKVETVDQNIVVTRETPFYTEMGGQVGDTGTIKVVGTDKIFETETVRSLLEGARLHRVKGGIVIDKGASVELHVDEPRRAKIEGHHSVTHIMHWALRKVLGTTVSQKGSYVGPDRLRFDFSHGTAMTPDEIAEVEKLVNEKIDADLPVSWEERPYAQVKGDPSILQFFGDKYGEMVRVVSIGDFSRELCGGTHVRHSSKIGYFKILHESAIAAGIRRIEAMSGEALRLHLEELLQKQEAQLAAVAVDRRATVGADAPISPRSQVSLGNALVGATSLPQLWQHYKDREKHLHNLELQRLQNEKDAAKKQEAEFQKRAATEAPELIGSAKTINEIPFIARQIDAPAAYLPVLADALKTRWQGVAVLATSAAGKVALLAAVAPAHTKKIQAGKIIQAIAPLVGGKGGGRPELAQGGGANPAGLPAALAKAEELL